MAKAKRYFRRSAESLESRLMMAQFDPSFGTNAGFTFSTLGADERSTTMGFLLHPNLNGPDGLPLPIATVLGGYQFNDSQEFPDSGQPELTFFSPTGQLVSGIGINGVITEPVGLGDSRIAGIASYRQNNTSYIVTAGYTEVSGDDLTYLPGLTVSTGNGFAVFSNSRDFFEEDIGTTLVILEQTANWRPGEYTIRDVQQVTPPGGTVPVGVAFLNQQLVDDPLIGTGGGVWMIQSPIDEDRPSTDFLISRYVLDLTNLQVTLDPTFGLVGNGHVIVPVASGVNSLDVGYSISVDQQNRTVVAGYSQSLDGDWDFSAVRLLANGRLDPGFVFTNQTPDGPVANPGRVQIDIQGDDFANAVNVSPIDGDIMIAGSSNGERQPLLTFVKLTGSGSLDDTFDGVRDGNGVVVIQRGTGGNGFINDIEQYPANAADGLGGFYIATGTNTGANRGTVLLRINDQTGRLDPTFTGSGIQRLNFSTADDWGNSVDLQRANPATTPANTFGIIVGGSLEVTNEGYNMYIARFDSDGSADETFNNNSNLFILPIQDDATANRDEYGATLFASPYDNPADPDDQFNILISGSAEFTAVDQFDFILAAVIGTPDALAPAVLNAVSRAVVETDTTTWMTVELELDTSESGPLTQPVTVNYTTQNGTAIAGTDYVAKTGSVTFSPGTTTRTVSVQVLGNTQYQPNRVFSLAITGVTGADLGQSTALVTIRDNDGTWQNVITPEDADADGDVEPSDVLKVIDDLKRNGIRQLAAATSTPALFADITGDTLASPSDVLAIIDRVNRNVSALQASSLQMASTTLTGSGFLSSVENSSNAAASSDAASWDVAQGLSAAGICPVGPYVVQPVKSADFTAADLSSGDVKSAYPPATDLAFADYATDLSDLSAPDGTDDADDLFALIVDGEIN